MFLKAYRCASFWYELLASVADRIFYRRNRTVAECAADWRCIHRFGACPDNSIAGRISCSIDIGMPLFHHAYQLHVLLYFLCPVECFRRSVWTNIWLKMISKIWRGLFLLYKLPCNSIFEWSNWHSGHEKRNSEFCRIGGDRIWCCIHRNLMKKLKCCIYAICIDWPGTCCQWIQFNLK